MECIVCGLDIAAKERNWESLHQCGETPPNVSCSYQCSQVLTRYAKIGEPRRNEVAVHRDDLCARAEYWLAQSDFIVTNPLLRIRGRGEGTTIRCAFVTRPGTLLGKVTDSELSCVVESCTPRCLVVEANFVASHCLSQGTVLTTASATKHGRDIFLQSIFGCDNLNCQCRADSHRSVRTLPCPLAPFCTSGGVVFSNVRGRWECTACGGYWDDGQFSPFLASETRCRAAYLEAAQGLYSDDGSFQPLTKATFESLKRVLSCLGDAGLGPDHGLYLLACELFVNYFVILVGTMKGSGTQQTAAQMAIRWSKLLLKSALVQISPWRYFGWYIGDVLGRVCMVSSRFPSLHSETVYLSRFGVATGFTDVFPSDANGLSMLRLVSKSGLGQIYSACEEWIDSFCDEASDLQRNWEDYLMAMAGRAIGSNHLKLERLLGKVD